MIPGGGLTIAVAAAFVTLGRLIGFVALLGEVDKVVLRESLSVWMAGKRGCEARVKSTMDDLVMVAGQGVISP
jgi:hypothetical protein